MNWNVINAGIRYGVMALGAALTMAATMGLLNADAAHNLVTAVQQLGTALTGVVAAVSAIAMIVTPLIGMWKSTHSSQVSAVKAGVASGDIPKAVVVAQIQATPVTPPAAK